nr:MAG TPA: hypothetical protein [Caudoviricetes sp.]
MLLLLSPIELRHGLLLKRDKLIRIKLQEIWYSHIC